MLIDDETAMVIDALVPQIVFEGWTNKALREALRSIGQSPEDAKLIFPGGPGEMIEAYFALSDARMEREAGETDLSAHRVPGRVRAIIAIRLEQNRGNREAIRRALSWLSLPTHAGRAARITAATVDSIWHAAGDTSADFSWYTKRGILAAVYSATLLYWLHDASEDDEATLRFLDRRLADVARIGKARKRVTGLFTGWRGIFPRHA
jgi:ubiquinone biosynthesis protein COQ9